MRAIAIANCITNQNDNLVWGFNMSLFYVNDGNFKSEVLNSAETVLVDFYADWCAPCRMIAPIVEEVSQSTKVCKVNVDESPAAAQAFGITSIPALVVIKDGSVHNRAAGYMEKNEILNLLK